MKFLLLVLFVIPAYSFAVDGYQDIKFNITYKELEAQKKCTLNKDIINSEPNVDAYFCNDFKMTPQKTVTVYFYFIEGSLLRIALNVGDTTDDFVAYFQALNNKYGQPSRKPAASELDMYDQGKSNNVDIGWDSDTVILRQAKNETHEFTLIVYSSPKYESELLKAKTKGLEEVL